MEAEINKTDGFSQIRAAVKPYRGDEIERIRKARPASRLPSSVKEDESFSQVKRISKAAELNWTGQVERLKNTKTVFWTCSKRMSKAIEERGFHPRFYRNWMKTKGLHSGRVAVCETDLQIITDLPFDYDDCRAAVESFRSDIIAYIKKDNRFLTSLEPVKVSSSAAPLVKRMASAGRKAGVGPMAR